MKTWKFLPLLGAIAGLIGCSAPVGTQEAIAKNPPPVVVDLRVRENPDTAYQSVDEFTVPATHEIGDGMMPYEGIGWENGYVAYRMYFDGRLVSDIFGKQVTDPVLSKIDAYGSYHELAPWGMDVLKVGPSLGLGGIGLMREGQPTQFGAVPELSAKITSSGGDTGAFTIKAGGRSAPANKVGGFSAEYKIGPESPMTRVKVSASGGLPLATGVVMHEGAQLLQSQTQSGDWRYVATWGDTQSENKDGLGMAVFYRASQASFGGLANATQFVAFNGPEFEYGFLAAWERDPSGIGSLEAFEAFLGRELGRLNGDAK